MANDETSAEGVGRREAIKKAAVVGSALVWATPVVQSIGMTSALAQQPSPTPGCPPGTQLATGFIKFEVDLGVFVPFSLEADACLEPGSGFCAAVNEYVANHFNEHMPGLVTGDGEITPLCITIPPDCTMIEAAAAKEGGECDPTPDGGNGTTSVCFEKDEVDGAVSNVQLAVTCCVPVAVLAACAP